MTVFISLLQYAIGEKATALRRAIFGIDSQSGEGSAGAPPVFFHDPTLFRRIPASVFAYWAIPSALSCFRRHKSLADCGIEALSTNQLSDDARYARLWWEVSPGQLNGWVNWAKGRTFSPYYFDLPTLVRWNNERGTYTGFLGTKDRPLERAASADWFFRPGLTWPRRTNRLSFSALPRGCVFGNKGPAIFVENDSQGMLLSILAMLNSAPFQYLLSLQVARVELAQSFEVGLVQSTPLPILSDVEQRELAELACEQWSMRKTLDTTNEISHVFLLPPGLNERITRHDPDTIHQKLEVTQREIDGRVFELYGIDSEDDRALMERAPVGVTISPNDTGSDADAEGSDEADEHNHARSIQTKLAVQSSWLVGVAFGRFDSRLATGDRTQPPNSAPFDPLPARSPGMLPESEQPADSPAILIDDEGHTDDLATRVQRIAELVGCSVPEKLRAWLARDFFPLHVRMYSKSRRKAPIYWQLATSSASYSVWLYIHAFTPDMLFRVQNDYANPKLAHEERRLDRMKQEAGAAPKAAERKAIAGQEVFVEELREFLDEIKRAAPLWNPNLDDGVIINFAPLWRLVPHHKPWQRELKTTWDALCAGDYDWSHLAMHLWPERVVPKCSIDRSLAIAHGLEEVFWIRGDDDRWTPRKAPTRSIDEIVQERTSTALKTALKSLLEAPAASGSTRQPTRARKTL